MSATASGGIEEATLGASVMEAMADPVIAVGSDTALLWGNRAAEERYGAPLAGLIGKSLAGWIHPDDLETALLAMVSVLAKDVGTLMELRIQDVTGEYSWFELRGRTWDDGPEGSVVLTLREITDRRRWEVSLGDAGMLGAILEHLPVIAMVVDADGTVRGANRALTRALHLDLELVRGRPLTDLVAPSDRRRVASALAEAAAQPGTLPLEARLARADDGELPMALSVVNLLDDRAVQGLLVTATDIGALVLARRELHRKASLDDLTGLPNRASLRDHLEAVLAGTASHSVLFADVDDLKLVNDRFGHRAGDTVLCTVARRLKASARRSDVVARLAGDEFVIVAGAPDPEAVTSLVDRIQQAMERPVELLDGRRVPVSISIGVADLAASLSADDVLAAADAAMYVSKRDRRP